MLAKLRLYDLHLDVYQTFEEMMPNIPCGVIGYTNKSNEVEQVATTLDKVNDILNMSEDYFNMLLSFIQSQIEQRRIIVVYEDQPKMLGNIKVDGFFLANSEMLADEWLNNPNFVLINNFVFFKGQYTSGEQYITMSASYETHDPTSIQAQVIEQRFYRIYIVEDMLRSLNDDSIEHE